MSSRLGPLAARHPCIGIVTDGTRSRSSRGSPSARSASAGAFSTSFTSTSSVISELHLYPVPLPFAGGECTKEEYECQTDTNRCVRCPFPFSLPASGLTCRPTRPARAARSITAPWNPAGRPLRGLEDPVHQPKSGASTAFLNSGTSYSVVGFYQNQARESAYSGRVLLLKRHLGDAGPGVTDPADTSSPVTTWREPRPRSPG